MIHSTVDRHLKFVQRYGFRRGIVAIKFRFDRSPIVFQLVWTAGKSKNMNCVKSEQSTVEIQNKPKFHLQRIFLAKVFIQTLRVFQPSEFLKFSTDKNFFGLL